jgi:hypothetical protein
MMSTKFMLAELGTESATFESVIATQENKAGTRFTFVVLPVAEKAIKMLTCFHGIPTFTFSKKDRTDGSGSFWAFNNTSTWDKETKKNVYSKDIRVDNFQLGFDDPIAKELGVNYGHQLALTEEAIRLVKMAAVKVTPEFTSKSVEF